MKISNTILAALMLLLVLSCGSPADNNDKKTTGPKAEAGTAAAPSFVIGVTPVATPANFPGLQSFVWARLDNKIVLFGGRTEGFHGLTGRDSAFKTRKANTAVYLIDLDSFSFQQMQLDTTDASLLQFFSANMEFCQRGDSLFVLGGYGRRQLSDAQSNVTFNTFVTISVSQLIGQVQQGNGNIKNAILSTLSSPFLQVTGGELVKQDNYFYLIGGQNFPQVYQGLGITGNYTSAVRKFSINNGVLADTSSYVDTVLHRRDFPATPVVLNGETFYAIFGGVFSANNDGYQHPVYIAVPNGRILVKQDTLTQMTSQYDCAFVSLYDPASNSNTTVLLGGIGKYQFHAATQTWENGDAGARLPFVNTITQMVVQNGFVKQNIQLPPASPALPFLLGANAIFVPYSNLLYSGNTIDYSKITSDSTVIGVMYGGIKSQLPTSSEIYPTSLNTTPYYVYLKKQ